MGKKSQITLFMIIGILLLAVFGFLFYISDVVVKEQAKRGVDKVVNEVITTSAINYYVTICLDKAAKNATITLAKQGGVIYQDQYDDDYLRGHSSVTAFPRGGVTGSVKTLNTNNFFPGTDTDVAYGLVRPGSTAAIGYLATDQILDLGEEKIFPLCSYDGPNKIAPGRVYPLPCRGVGSDVSGALGIGSYDSETEKNSMQRQLANYTSYLVYKCMDVTAFEQKGYSVKLPEDIETVVVLGEENTEFHLRYPLTILVQGHEPIVKYPEFHISLPVAFKKLGTFVWNLVYNDGRRIFFEIDNSNQYQHLYGWRSGIEVVQHPGTSDDLIIVTDSNSNNLVGGEPIVIQFAVENRGPVLNWIHEDGSEPFDIMVKQGGIINLPPYTITTDKPYAFDPDGNDVLTFSYSRWKQDYNEAFKPIGCCSNFPGNGNFNCSDLDGDDGIQNCIQVEEPPYVGPKWTDAPFNPVNNPQSLYLTEVPNSALPSRDLGVHTTRVTVKDESGLIDYQDVAIFVYQCDADNDCSPYKKYYCEGNQLYRTEQICNSHYLCGDAPSNTPIVPICKGTEDNKCIDGEADCVNFCGEPLKDYDGDGCDNLYDSDCSGIETDCHDIRDNDCDGSTDCADSDCSGNPYC